jgi:chloramphenicol 3-O-phosphotransferase
MSRVPVLLFTGPVGVGKTTVAGEAGSLLSEAGIAYAGVDLPRIGECFPAPDNDPWNERITHRNLASVWANYRAAGAERLILTRVLEARSLLRRVEDAVPGADVTVVRLRAPLAVLHARIAVREAGRDHEWYTGAATYLHDAMERQAVEDFVVESDGRPARAVAREALQLAGWLRD